MSPSVLCFEIARQIGSAASRTRADRDLYQRIVREIGKFKPVIFLQIHAAPERRSSVLVPGRVEGQKDEHATAANSCQAGVTPRSCATKAERARSYNARRAS